MRLMSLVAVAVLGLAVSARAEDKSVSFGVQGSWGNDSDFGVGARVIAPLNSLQKGVEGIASFDYFFPSTGDGGFDSGVKYWEANANLVYRLPGKRRSSVRPYLGAGLNVAHGSFGSDDGWGGSGSSTKVGLNLLGGLTFSERFFLESKFEAGGGEQFVVSGGFRF